MMLALMVMKTPFMAKTHSNAVVAPGNSQSSGFSRLIGIFYFS